MNLPYELFLFGVSFFGFMAIVSAVQARRKKEKTYYLGAVAGFVVLLAFVSAFLNQLILAFILIIATGILSAAGLPKMLKVQKRELAKQLQEADLSSPLRVRDFFTTKWWLKRASKWGLLKTTCLYYLLSVVIIGGILFTLSTFFSFITIRYVVSYTVIFPVLSTFIFYWQFRKVLERNENAHGPPLACMRRCGVNMKDAVYVEWVPAGTLIKALVGIFSLLSLCVLLITIAVGVAIQHPLLIVVLASPLAFVLFLFWNYRGIRIKVNSKNLLIYYGFFNRRGILMADIVSCEPTKASFGRYGGIGIRYGTDGSWAYTTSFGNAVKIILQKGKPFVFSSINPEKICRVINQIKDVS